MYTLKGLFPEPKKDSKKNFIKENMRQLKSIQGKASPKEPKFTMKNVHGPRLTNQMPSGHLLGSVKSSPSSKSGKVTLTVGKSSFPNSKKSNVKIKKGDMAEFLRRKESRQQKADTDSQNDAETEEESLVREIACQTLESALSNRESTKLTQLYPIKNFEEGNAQGSGDSRCSPSTPKKITPRARVSDAGILETERRSRLNSILERRDPKEFKDPYLPTGYQKGVVPKYLRKDPCKESTLPQIEGARAEDGECPAGHVTLPDNERKETLRMLRNSFAELVSELNKLPVKTDTLRMRNRKMELEKQLAKLEDGIKVFSRPKVFVKIGE